MNWYVNVLDVLGFIFVMLCILGGFVYFTARAIYYKVKYKIFGKPADVE